MAVCSRKFEALLRKVYIRKYGVLILEEIRYLISLTSKPYTALL